MKKSLTSSIYTFENLRTSGKLYVDKTEYIWKMVESAPVMYFLSRPRRFGKSLTVSTLKAVFEGKKELFKGLAIYDKPYDWKKYPVIHLDMNGWDFSTIEMLQHSLCGMIREQAEKNDIQIADDNATAMFRMLINKLNEKGPIILLLDEYDKPVLNNITESNAKDFLKVLKPFYSVIKEKEKVIRFAFVTGVTKFCHVSLFSDLNNLTDITMSQDYAAMLGYTQQEFETNFKEWIAETEVEQDLPHDEYLAVIKKWYDGYRFHIKAENVYNPVSLANFFMNHGEFNNYWFETGTPSFLMDLIRQKNMDLERALAEPATDFVFGAFELDDIPPLTLLLQTGYLTIKSSVKKYDSTIFKLDFPNREVSESFNIYLVNYYTRQSKNDVSSFCYHLSDAVVEGDLPKFQKTLEIFFAGIPYDVHRKNEANFQNIFFAIFKLLGYNIFAESRTSDGRIDAVIETELYIYLFEFKLNDDATALSQMKEKEYFKPYLLPNKKITLVGANFDTQTGRISNWRNESVKQ